MSVWVFGALFQGRWLGLQRLGLATLHYQQRLPVKRASATGEVSENRANKGLGFTGFSV